MVLVFILVILLLLLLLFCSCCYYCSYGPGVRYFVPFYLHTSWPWVVCRFAVNNALIPYRNFFLSCIYVQFTNDRLVVLCFPLAYHLAFPPLLFLLFSVPFFFQAVMGPWVPRSQDCRTVLVWSDPLSMVYSPRAGPPPSVGFFFLPVERFRLE